jgi:hypothetical protein
LDDGGCRPIGIPFYTNSFDLEGIKRLKHALFVNFKLKSNIHIRKSTGAYMIYIPNSSLESFKELVQPYFIPHFQYKLKLRGSYSS